MKISLYLNGICDGGCNHGGDSGTPFSCEALLMSSVHDFPKLKRGLYTMNEKRLAKYGIVWTNGLGSGLISACFAFHIEPHRTDLKLVWCGMDRWTRTSSRK